MVHAEDDTLEKTKTQELPVEINTLSDTLQQKAFFTENSFESPQLHIVDS